MRFEELLNRKNPADLTVNELRSKVGSWLKIMASWRYKRDTRIEHVQQALDQLYTSLERKLNTSNSGQVMKHPLWQAMVGMVADYFPGEVEVYYPTPVEQQRTLMLIRNSIATGIIKDKRRLLKEYMSHHEYHVKTLSQLAHSRLKLQLLAASSKAVLARYQASQHDSWDTWFRWANRRDIGHESDTSTEVEENCLAVGKVTARAGGSAMIGRGVEYDSHDSSPGSNWRHQASASGAIYGEGGAAASAGYNREQLNTAAVAGLEGEAGMRGEVEVKTEYAVKITSDAARRMLGSKFKIIEAHAEAHGKTGLGGSASVQSRAGLGGMAGAEHGYDPEEGSGQWKEVGGQGIRAGGEGEIWIGFTLSGQAGLTVAQSLELGVSGDVFGGARAGVESGFFIESSGVRFGAGAEVFAGFEAAVEERVTIKHPKRKLEIFTVKSKQAFTAGIGAGAGAEFSAGIERFSLSAESQTTLGIGSKISTTMGISPLALGLTAYDMAIVPSLWALNHRLKMDPRLSKTSFARHMNRVVEAVDGMADAAEVRALSRECDAVIAACLGSLDQDAEWLQTLRPRQAGADYGAMPEPSSVAGFTGHTQSSFYTYDKASGRKTGVDEDALADVFSQLQVASDIHYKGASEKAMRRPVDLKILTREVNTNTHYDWMFGKFAAQDRRYGT